MSVAHAESLSPPAQPAGGVLSALWTRAREEAAVTADWLRRTGCGLRGHDMMLRFDPDRVSLACVSCGHNSPGWTVGRR
jgi:hypothetical protein